MIAGNADKVTKAATSATSELYCPWNCMVPSGKVQSLSESRITRGVSRSFQLTIMVKAPTAARAGRASGSRMRQKKPNAEQPSIEAASCSSTGDRQKESAQDQDVPGYSECGLHQDDSQEGIGQMHLADHEVDRHNGNGDREHETQGEKVESQLLAPELHPGKYKGSQAASDQHTGRRRHHDDEAVAQHGPE